MVFFVCDDNPVVLSSIVEIIKDVTKGMKCKILSFNDYNDHFMNAISQDNSPKIYVLDIETPSRSGIDVARIIRETDYNSIIIFLTVHSELTYQVLGEEFMVLAFISKFNDYKNTLKQKIEKAIKIIGKNQVVSFESLGIKFNITLDSILYITTDTIERKIIIVTNNNEFKANYSLNEFIILLNSDFKQIHRACYVNETRITKIDKINRIILFDNNITCSIVSDEYLRKNF